MPPQIKFAQIILLGNAARGHVNQPGGHSIIRWSCNPPPPPGLLRKRSALAKLKGSALPASILKGPGKGTGASA